MTLLGDEQTSTAPVAESQTEASTSELPAAVPLPAVTSAEPAAQQASAPTVETPAVKEEAKVEPVAESNVAEVKADEPVVAPTTTTTEEVKA